MRYLIGLSILIAGISCLPASCAGISVAQDPTSVLVSNDQWQVKFSADLGWEIAE